MQLYSTKDTIHHAIDTFHLDREGYPELVPLGLPPVDDVLGGLGPRACGILAAATGVGKSSTMLAAMLASPVPVGAVSLEDGPDVIGCRLLAALTGISSLRIRRKHLTKEELVIVNAAGDKLKKHDMFFVYPTAGRLHQVETAVKMLTGVGAKMVWLDYLQKVRGHGGADRRNEVGETFTTFQRACAEGDAAGMAISQFRRLTDAEKTPQIYHLKESGDLENEARLIILAHRLTMKDEDDNPEEARVRFRVGKSTYGGEDIVFDYVRDQSGTLRHASLFSPLDDF